MINCWIYDLYLQKISNTVEGTEETTTTTTEDNTTVEDVVEILTSGNTDVAIDRADWGYIVDVVYNLKMKNNENEEDGISYTDLGILNNIGIQASTLLQLKNGKAVNSYMIDCHKKSIEVVDSSLFNGNIKMVLILRRLNDEVASKIK